MNRQIVTYGIHTIRPEAIATIVPPVPLPWWSRVLRTIATWAVGLWREITEYLTVFMYIFVAEMAMLLALLIATFILHGFR